MADTAYQVAYIQSYIMGYERNQSLLRNQVTTEADIKGNQAVFLVADSGSASTTTRGTNGLIPYRADNNQQYTATLTEQYDAVRKLDFNIMNSQGNQMEIMQKTSYGTVNREVDDQILTALSAATQTQGSATTASLRMFTRSKAILGVNNVPNDGMLTAVISPACHAYLMETKQFTSAEYIKGSPLDSGAPRMFMWFGMYFIEHSGLPGVGTASETMYVFHKNAIGHAMNLREIDMQVGYNGEHRYSWANASFYGGAKLLQNSGIIKILHDGSDMVAE